MRRSAFFRLLGLNLRSNARNLIMSSFGIIVGIGLFAFFLSLGLGVREVVNQIIGTLPVNQLEVVPKTFTVGATRHQQGGSIDDDVLDRLRSLPHVKAAHGKMNLRVPTHAQIPLPKAAQRRGLTSHINTDVVAQGISPDAIAPDKPAYKEFHDIPSTLKRIADIKQPIPVLISPTLLQSFNVILSSIPNFPELNPKLIRILSFELWVGISVYRTRRHKRGVTRLKCRVVGVSSRAIRLGITIPLPYVRVLNRYYNGKDAKAEFVSAIVETTQAEQTPAVLKRLGEMGYTLEQGQRIARKIGEILLLIVLLLSLISVVIMSSAAISISHVFFMSVYERRYQIGLMRSVGATRGTIRALVMMEAAVVGVLNGVAGLGLFWGASALVRWALSSLQGLPFSPDLLFFFPAWLPALAIAFAIMFCLLGSFFPARRAAALDPIQVLSSK